MVNLFGYGAHAHTRRFAKDPVVTVSESLDVETPDVKEVQQPQQTQQTEQTTQTQTLASTSTQAVPLSSTVVQVVYYSVTTPVEVPVMATTTLTSSVTTPASAPVALLQVATSADVSTRDEVLPSQILPDTANPLPSSIGVATAVAPLSSDSSDLVPAIIATAGSEAPDAAGLVTASGSPTVSRSRTLAATTPIRGATSTAETSAAATSSSSGMTTGGKAGIAIGIILLAGAILSVLLFCLKKRKNQSEKKARNDDEKNPFSNAAAIVPMTTNNAPKATAPQLSLRPVTQFLPYGNEQQQSNGIPLAEAAPKDQNRLNPFGNHAESIDATKSREPQVLPFVNSPGPTPSIIAPGPLTSAPTAGVAAAGVAVTTLTRSASKMGPKMADFTKSSGSPPSPTGSSYSDGTEGTSQLSPNGAAAAGAPASNVHRVQLDFVPSMDDELALRAGSLVRLLHEYDDGWAMCIRLDRSKQGVVPRTCLSARPVKPRSQQPRAQTSARQGPPRAPVGPPMSHGPLPPAPSAGRGLAYTHEQDRARSVSPNPFSDGPRSASPTLQPVQPFSPLELRAVAPLDQPSRTASPSSQYELSFMQTPTQHNETGSVFQGDNHFNLSQDDGDVSPISTANSLPSSAISRKQLPGQAL